VSGSLIPISDEQAKLGREVLKTLRGLGSFFEKALGSTPEDLVAYLGGDWLRVRRAENLVKLFQGARRRLADRHVEEPIPASLSVALPILQGAADEDREELVDLWARLLANAMDPKLNSVRQSFIDAVKKMDPKDAVVLQDIYKGGFEVVRRGVQAQETNQTTGIDNIARRIRCRGDDVEVSIRHLEMLSFFDINPDIKHNWFVNATSREFKRACYPEIDGSAGG
jgi:hypothetical protein